MRQILFFAILVLAGLACKSGNSLPTEPTASMEIIQIQAKLQPTDQQGSLVDLGCSVKTGIEGGAVHIRSCPGISCSVIGYLQERERLSVVEHGIWLKVKTITGAEGYVHSNFIQCMEVTK